MLIFHNPDHALHCPRQEMYRGRLVPCHETPARLEHVLTELRRRPVGELREPGAPDEALLRRVHAPRYLDFLAGAWSEWVALDAANAELDVLPSVWPVRGFRHDVEPTNFAARLGLYSFDAGTPLVGGSWAAALRGAACAIDAARAVLASDGPRVAFALTRPQLVQSRRAQAGGFQQISVAHHAHDHRARVPAAGGQAAEQRVGGGCGVVEMEGLGVEFAGEADHLVALDALGAELAHRAGSEVFPVPAGGGAVRIQVGRFRGRTQAMAAGSSIQVSHSAAPSASWLTPKACISCSTSRSSDGAALSIGP